MPRVKQYTSSTNPLTLDEVAALGADFAGDMGDEPDRLARFLLLCHALTYEGDFTERENMMRRIEAGAAPLLAGFDKMLDGELRGALDALRKGGK